MARLKQAVIGFDLGGTKMMAAVVDQDFKIVERFRKRTRPEEGPEPVFQNVVGLIREAIEVMHLTPKTLKGIGVGCPCPVETKSGVLLLAANLGFRNFPLAAKLRKVFSVPVAVDNDVNLGAYAEYCFGAVKGLPVVLAIFPGTGIGGALLLNGKVFKGAHGSAGEIGHMVLDTDGPLCGCGRRGCLEALASRSAVTAQAALLALRGDAPHLMADSGTNLAKIRSGALVRAIKAGDSSIEQVVRRSARYMGLVASGLVNFLDPNAVLLGGGMVDAMPILITDEVRKMINQHSFPSLAKEVRVVPSALGDDAVCMGAAKIIVEQIRSPQRKTREK